MQRYLCKVYVFNISKIDIFGKNAWFLATPLFTETIPQGVLIIIEGGGKVQYITKQKEKNVLALASGSLLRQK